MASLLDALIYLSEPCSITRTFAMTSALLDSGGPPCITGDEGLAEGPIPRSLPGQTPFLDEMIKLYEARLPPGKIRRNEPLATLRRRPHPAANVSVASRLLTAG